MRYDIQKAGLMRRISAGMFDAILLVVLICGIAWGISALVDYDTRWNAVVDFYEKYEQEYDIDFSVGDDVLATMPEDELAVYDEALEAMNNDDSALYAFMQLIWSSLVVISLSVLTGHILLEFLVPVLLKNGQTLGKKIFGVALMRKDGVMVTNFAMFVRSILGKCTIEVMVPVLVLLLMLMGTAGLVGPIILLVLFVVQIALLIFHPHNAVLHDLLSCTVAVDISSQLIFTSAEAKLAYLKERAADKAEQAEY